MAPIVQAPAPAAGGNWWSGSPVVQPAAAAPRNPWDNDPIVRAAPAASDPWAAFPIAQPAPSPAASDWAAFPIEQSSQAAPQKDPYAQFADAPADHSTLTVHGGRPAPAAGLFDDLIPQAQPDPGVLQHMWNAASRVPANLLGKLEAINPHDINQTVDSLAAGIPYSDRISAAAAAATGIGGQFGDYAGNLAADRAATEARTQADPSREMVGQFVGGAMLPVGAANKALQGATLGAKLGRGALAGSALGIVQGSSSSDDFGDIPQAAISTAIGTGTGAGIGLAAPLLGAGAGAAARRLLGQTVPTVAGPGGPIQRPAQQYLMDAIKADGPGAIGQGLHQLGDQGMLADYGNNLRGVAQGLAIKPGAADQNVVQALEKIRRDELASRRERRPEPRPVTSPATHAEDVNAAIAPYAQAQQQALKAAGPIDVSGPFIGIHRALQDVAPGSPEHTALNQARTMLTAPDGRAVSAKQVYSARQALDDLIEYDGPAAVPSYAIRSQQGALQRVRGHLNDTLRTQVPGYADATDAIAAQAPRRNATPPASMI